MQPHKIVSREEWIETRKALMAREKELTRARDRLSEERRALPWVKVDKTYVFEGPDGRKALADLFGGRSQLVVQHFMFAPDWNEGCKSCSFWVDQFDHMVPHLAARDTTLVAISRAPLHKLEAFKARMGWTFDWFSSADTDFNHDYAVSFRLDMMNAAYHYLDLTPLGRHEEGLSYPMAWLRLRDQYEPAAGTAACSHS
jgi:predicted dithiol-disulfide oxidoreductase (DUF899 family)